MDVATISSLAATTVTLLTPVWSAIVDGGAKELGKTSVAAIIDSLKARLRSTPAEAALTDAEKDPKDADTQAALRKELKKAMQNDESLTKFISEWTAQAEAVLGTSVRQSLIITGDNNRTVQVSGSGNNINNA